jgi:hypothetical protein
MLEWFIRETIEGSNWLAFTVPLIAAGGAYFMLKDRSWPKVLAGIIAFAILAVFFIGYSFMYRSIGFPFWMRWLTPASVDAEPLPGRPEVQINTKLDADWAIVGMNYDWMVLVAMAPTQIGKHPHALIRWEYTKPQKVDDDKPYLSEVEWVELDCPENRFNLILVNSYAENNFSGTQVYTGFGSMKNPQWIVPEPQSISGAAVREACKLFGN